MLLVLPPLVVGRAHQRAQAHPDAAHVRGRRRAGEVARRFAQDEGGLFLERARLALQILAGAVGGAEDDLAEPGHGEEDAAVCRLRHHHRVVGGKELPVHHDVHALAGRDDGPRGPAEGFGVLAAQAVHPDPRGIDDAARPQGVWGAGFGVLAAQARDLAVLVDELARRAVVDEQRAAQRRGARERQGEPCVVELAVPILDAALQAIAAHGGQKAQRALPAQEFGGTQAGAARQQVVGLEAHAVEGRLPETVGRHHEGQRLRQVRRIAEQRGALVQCLAHERDVALREVADTAVHELGGARGRAFREIVGLDQDDAEAARRGVERRAQPRRPAPDDRQVVLAGFGKLRQQSGAVGGQGRVRESHGDELSIQPGQYTG